VMSCLVTALGGGAFLGDVKPPSLDIWWRVDRTGTCGSGNGSPRARLSGDWVCPEPGYEVEP
jgi:hypothetical protein